MTNVLVLTTRKILAIALMFVLLSVPLASQHVVSAQTSTTGIIVPLYAYPTDSSWQQLIQTKSAYPNVPVAAVVNPSNGPGSGPDPNFVQGINNLRAAGILVLGYIPTGYGSIGQSYIDSQIYDYRQWYNINGIFFDTMNNVPGYESYYSSLSGYAASIGLTWNVGNPGAPVPASYVGTMNTIIIYENAGLPSLSTLSSSTDGYPASNFGFEAYAVGGFSQSYVSTAENYDSWMYITNGLYPDPYSVLPSYLTTLMSDLGDGPSSPSQPVGGTVPITVQSVEQDGTPINGLYTIVQSTSGAVLATGFTPLTYDASPGSQLQITVDNYANYYFNDWNTGSTGATIAVTASQGTTLTAYFGNTVGSQNNQEATLTINTVDQNGAPIDGLYTVIQSSSGATLATGFSPLTYDATSGLQYTVTVSNYGSYYFSSWSNGTTSQSTAITPSQSTTLTATYQSGQSAQPTLTVESEYQNGTPISGLFVTVESTGGSVIASGFTPFTFQGTSGATYTVISSNYGPYTFINWSTGSSDNHLTISLSQSTTLIAYY